MDYGLNYYNVDGLVTNMPKPIFSVDKKTNTDGTTEHYVRFFNQNYEFQKDWFKIKPANAEFTYEQSNGFRLKHSSTSSFRLNNAGLTVFTTLLAKQDNCPDVDTCSDEAKKLLDSKSVQKHLIDLYQNQAEIKLIIKDTNINFNGYRIAGLSPNNATLIYNGNQITDSNTFRAILTNITEFFVFELNKGFLTLENFTLGHLNLLNFTIIAYNGNELNVYKYFGNGINKNSDKINSAFISPGTNKYCEINDLAGNSFELIFSLYDN